MLASGIKYIKEKLDLDIQVHRLNLLKSNFLSNKYSLEDKILKDYPQMIIQKKSLIQGFKVDLEFAKQHTKSHEDEFAGMTIRGVFYSDKAEAGEAILVACKEMKGIEPVHLGEYRGFNMNLCFDTYDKIYYISLKNEMSHIANLGTDVIGNITRMDNVIEKIPQRLKRAEQDLANIEKQFETAKEEVKKEFPQEEELKEKTERLAVLDRLLNLDKVENEIVGDEQPQEDMEQERKVADRER